MLGCLIVALLNVKNESKFFFEYSTWVVFIKFTQKEPALLSTDATKKGPSISRQQQNTELKKYCKSTNFGSYKIWRFSK